LHAEQNLFFTHIFEFAFIFHLLVFLVSTAIDSIMETPDPIPNSMVKLDSADDTASVDVAGK
jgi:hypothetical protein